MYVMHLFLKSFYIFTFKYLFTFFKTYLKDKSRSFLPKHCFYSFPNRKKLKKEQMRKGNMWLPFFLLCTLCCHGDRSGLKLYVLSLYHINCLWVVRNPDKINLPKVDKGIERKVTLNPILSNLTSLWRIHPGSIKQNFWWMEPAYF